MRASTSPRLTAALRQQILASVRSGGFAHVAAAAWGVPFDVLESWLRRGRSERRREPYSSFAADLAQAEAQARLRAEVGIFDEQPRIWLQHGPGREQRQRPGWSSAVKPHDRSATATNALLDPRLMRFCEDLLLLLAPYPELRQHAVALLERARKPNAVG
jgi:hypothetical protein